MENDGREISGAYPRKLLILSSQQGEMGWGQLVNDFITFLRHSPQAENIKALGTAGGILRNAECSIR